SVTAATRRAKYSQPPYSVSSDLGQLAASRHLISGIDCAIAGAAMADAARPIPAACRNSRRFLASPRLKRTPAPREVPQARAPRARAAATSHYFPAAKQTEVVYGECDRVQRNGRRFRLRIIEWRVVARASIFAQGLRTLRQRDKKGRKF